MAKVSSILGVFVKMHLLMVVGFSYLAHLHEVVAKFAVYVQLVLVFFLLLFCWVG